MQAEREGVPNEVDRGVENDARRLRSGIAWTLALAGLLIAIGLAVPDLRSVLDRAVEASGWWLVLAVALELGSCLGYVATVRLVLTRGPAREVRRLAWAEMAFGAVVPIGGAGGLAVGAWAMRAWGIAWSRIANRSAVIFLLTSAVNAAVLGLTGVGVWIGLGSAKTGVLYGLLPALVGFGAIALFVGLARVPSRRLPGRPGRPLHTALGSTGGWVRDTEQLVRERHWRLLGAIAYLLCDIAVLWACMRAVGAHPPILALLAGYQIGYLANLVPIPGGLGVLDGGLLAALMLYGISPARAAAAVVLYHAIALWLPTIGGTVGFFRLRGVLAARGRRGEDPGARGRRGEDPGARGRRGEDPGARGRRGEDPGTRGRRGEDPGGGVIPRLRPELEAPLPAAD